MHGYGGSSEDMKRSYGWVELADEQGFVVCFPDGTIDEKNNQFWNVGYAMHSESSVDDTGFIVGLTKHLEKKYDLDPHRTFATGLSNGGDMSFLLASHAPEHFAAIGPVVGTMMETLYSECDPAFPCPVIAFNGTDDRITKYAGDMANEDGWGPYQSTPRVIELWARLNKTTETTTTQLPDVDTTDGSIVELERHWSHEHNREVHFYRVVGGGHDWPGAYGNKDIEATPTIWAFFEAVSTSTKESP